MLKACEILFVSVLILDNSSDSRIRKSIFTQLEYHHKSIDLIYERSNSCKIVITDNFTATLLEKEAKTNFKQFLVDSASSFSSISRHPWLSNRNPEFSKTAMINGCPLPRMHFVSQFLMSLEQSQQNIVFIDIDTLILRDLRGVFSRYPMFDVGFTMGGHYVKKQDPNHFINVGVIFIRNGTLDRAANLLSTIANYCTELRSDKIKNVILDQYSTFHVLDRYKVATNMGSLLGVKIIGNCMSILVTKNEIPVRINFLSDEYNTPPKKLYKTSQVAHFAGPISKDILMKIYGEYLIHEGVNQFMKNYARRTYSEMRGTPPKAQNCT